MNNIHCYNIQLFSLFFFFFFDSFSSSAKCGYGDKCWYRHDNKFALSLLKTSKNQKKSNEKAKFGFDKEVQRQIDWDILEEKGDDGWLLQKCRYGENCRKKECFFFHRQPIKQNQINILSEEVIEKKNNSLAIKSNPIEEIKTVENEPKIKIENKGNDDGWRVLTNKWLGVCKRCKVQKNLTIFVLSKQCFICISCASKGQTEKVCQAAKPISSKKY